jgi:hypothetical protein
MPTDSDRDSLAQIIYTAKPEARYQTWEHTSDGIRRWCRAKADDAMAAGWRKVGAQDVVVPKWIVDEARFVIRRDNDLRVQYTHVLDTFDAALADPEVAS